MFKINKIIVKEKLIRLALKLFILQIRRFLVYLSNILKKGLRSAFHI
jgi:hypothetical protein